VIHSHNHEPADYNRAFAFGVVLNLAYIVAEVAYGIIGDSLALLADAGHNLSDVLSLLFAWGATYLASRKASVRRTYGLRRSTILAALLNAILLLTAIGAVAWEAMGRFASQILPDGAVIVWVAGVGVLVNAGTALMFMAGRKHDLNIRGAFLHMAADAVVSLGVVISGGLVLLTGWAWLDPLTSLVIVAIIMGGTWGLFRESLDLALDAVPAHIDPQAVEAYLRRLPGVHKIHDLHIWAMSTTEVALTVHLVHPEVPLPSDIFLREVSLDLRRRFGISHATIQMESGNEAYPCYLESAERVP
jgi:cobalt-zinc-cadmium efflux system protein